MSLCETIRSALDRMTLDTLVAVYNVALNGIYGPDGLETGKIFRMEYFDDVIEAEQHSPSGIVNMCNDGLFDIDDKYFCMGNDLVHLMSFSKLDDPGCPFTVNDLVHLLAYDHVAYDSVRSIIARYY